MKLKYVKYYYYEDKATLKEMKKKIPDQEKSKTIRKWTKEGVKKLSGN